MKILRSHTLLLITAAGIYLAWTQAAQARTVSVKEIVKPPSAGGAYTLLLDHDTKEFLRKNTLVAPIQINETPLVAAKQRLSGDSETTAAVAHNPKAAYAWIENKSKSVAEEPEDARLVMEDGRVTDFSPGKTALLVDPRASALALLTALDSDATAFEFAGVKTGNTKTLAETNSLGINEFLAGGVSDFSGSSKNRRANIAAGIKKVKGVLIAPGETFSFNKYLGDVTAEDGFKPEIVIKADGLKPELGGGICQVSSTLFRAAMQAGLPIVSRRNHAFSVNHYFPPGTDATVYSPYTDLKFTNDTPAHVLIWPYYNGDNTLVFDLYGTRDTRSVVVDEPIQWDRKSDGSMKASWTRHVTKSGVTRDDTLKSNYLPPAIFKKEEKFIAATPAVAPTPQAAVTESITPKEASVPQSSDAH